MGAGRLGVEWLTKYIPAFLIFKGVFGLFVSFDYGDGGDKQRQQLSSWITGSQKCFLAYKNCVIIEQKKRNSAGRAVTT